MTLFNQKASLYRIVTFLVSLLFLVLTQVSIAQVPSELIREPLTVQDSDYWSVVSSNCHLNPEYAFLEGLDFYSLAYLSDSLLVSGYMIEPKGEGTYPVIFFNRGGNRDFSALSMGLMIEYTARLAAAGYIVMASNYRAADEFGGADLQDITRLMDLSAEVEKVDTARMGMFGWSRGGMMTYMMLARDTRIKTAVIGNGPCDLRSIAFERPGWEKKVLGQCIPDYWENKEAALSVRSVIDWTERLNQSTSLLILAGTKDRLLDYHQHEQLAEKLDDTTIRYELKIFETDHVFSDKKVVLHAELLQWFERELKGLETE